MLICNLPLHKDVIEREITYKQKKIRMLICKRHFKESFFDLELHIRYE